ncbi:Hsp20/alpha crystallin family protein [Priestia megaterium]
MSKNFNSFHQAQKVLGDDFWEILSDVYPMVGPRVDVLRSDNDMKIVIEIPGIQNQDDIKLYFQNKNIVVSGEIPGEISGYTFEQQERFCGPFKRVIRIPTNAILEQLTAHYQGGLMVIHVPLSGPYEENDMIFPIHFSND